MDLLIKKDYKCYLENIEVSFKKDQIVKNAKPEAIELLLYQADFGKGVAEVYVEKKNKVNNPDPDLKQEEPKKPEEPKIETPKKTPAPKPRGRKKG